MVRDQPEMLALRAVTGTERQPIGLGQGFEQRDGGNKALPRRHRITDREQAIGPSKQDVDLIGNRDRFRRGRDRPRVTGGRGFGENRRRDRRQVLSHDQGPSAEHQQQPEEPAAHAARLTGTPWAAISALIASTV